MDATPAGHPPSPNDPVGGPAVDAATVAAQLSPAEVNDLLLRATAADPFDNAIIAVVDRGGRVLGVRVDDQVSPDITGNADTLVFAVDLRRELRAIELERLELGINGLVEPLRGAPARR